jgi:hypothetical protein
MEHRKVANWNEKDKSGVTVEWKEAPEAQRDNAAERATSD